MELSYRRSMRKLLAVLVCLSALFGIAYLAGQYLDLLMLDTDIYDAVCQGDVELIDRWLRWGTDVNCKQADTGKTPLHQACEVANLTSVEWLLRRGADINARDARERTPLEAAASQNHRDIVDRLQKSGATFTLRAAVLLRDFDSVKRLVEAHPEDVGSLLKSDVDMSTEFYCIVQSTETFLFLLEHGLDPNVSTLIRAASPNPSLCILHPIESLLAEAVAIGDPKLLTTLLDRGARFRGPEEFALVFTHLRRQHKPKLLRLLRQHDAIPAKDIPPDLQGL